MAYYSDEGTAIHTAAAGLGDMGPSLAFRDGSLGNDVGPSLAFRDGSLGDVGPSLAYRDGSLGRGCRSCGGLGATGVVYDMTQPALILEFKGLMAFLGGPSMASSPEAVEMLNRADWDDAARTYMGQLLQAIGSTGIDTAAWAEPSRITPTATGLIGLAGMAGKQIPLPELAKAFPNISAFIANTGGLPENGQVIPPPVPAAAKAADSGLKTSHMALIGIGVLAVAFLLMRKK